MAHRDLHLPVTIIAYVVWTLSTSCSGFGASPPKAEATKVLLVTEPSAVAETMLPITTQPVVQVAVATGRAVPGATTITAMVVSGSGAIVAGASVETDAGGSAAFSSLTLAA